MLFAEEDGQYLRMAGEVISDQIKDMLDLWYGVVGLDPLLIYYFSGADSSPNPKYLAAVRKRFG